jgi:hypothetical protein
VCAPQIMPVESYVAMELATLQLNMTSGPVDMLMLVGVAVDNAKVLLYPDQRELDEACVPPTMRWRVREGGPERWRLCDGGRFIAVDSKEAELAALKISGIRGPPHPPDPPPPLDRSVVGAAVNRAGLSEEAAVAAVAAQRQRQQQQQQREQQQREQELRWRTDIKRCECALKRLKKKVQKLRGW